MRPRLVSVSGTQPAEMALGEADLTIGRDASNSIPLEDPAVSSRHCVIVRDRGRFVVRDRDSTNGTFVNGKATNQADLKHGDEIQVGHVRFYFLVEEGSIPLAPKVTIEDREADELISSETVQLDPVNSSFLRRNLSLEDAALQRRAKDLSVLVRLNAELHDIPDTETLQKTLLERIFETIPAENGAILLGNTVDQMVSGATLSRRPARSLYVSRTILQQVMASGRAVLRNDLHGQGDVSQSLKTSGLRSVLCVPLTVTSVRTGVVYLSNTNPSTRFDEQHLEMAVAVAGIGALALEHARYVEWLEVQNSQLLHEAALRHEMVGDNPRMKNVYEAISLIAPTDSPALVLGESGTGKELAARAIHNNSSRKNGPFVAVNCGAVVDTLFASQLFGYVRGAFTGADRDHKGFIEDADGGTLFLDELGDLPLHCQAALLRVLEEGKVQRVGSSREIPVDVRLISATNRSLVDEIRKGNFRSDLYFRMGLPVELPPLRERLDDIPLLVAFFLQKYKSQTQRELGPTHPETIRVLQQYAWPGNVRELGNAIRWAVVFGKSNRLRPEDLPPEIAGKGSSPSSVPKLEAALQSYERQVIVRALEETRGNVVEAARLLDRAPNYLQRRISQLNLRGDLDRIRGTS
ncbi:MAG TPA: sigma 54-interacting transcriptional regulator [Terriglobia bacterium]|nr:sigma 54-interacting transcriptional regulator [Terriglobia bacterium]